MHEPGARCTDDSLTFRVADQERRLDSVRLIQHAGLPGDRLDFARGEDGDWHLFVPRPALWRLEYRLELRTAAGLVDTVCDPGNPRRVGSSFGERSVVECTDYAEPAWLSWPTAPGSWREFTVPALETGVPVRAWSPEAPAEHVLVANDGPEYDVYGGLAHYLAAFVAAGGLPPHHLVLLAPGERRDWYSANPVYASALVDEVLPTVHSVLGTGGPVIGVGASLGALAMLHAHLRHPGTFGGLFLQSGSFFQWRFDAQEQTFPQYARVVSFVDEALAGGGEPVPCHLTCGLVEENLANNRDMAAALARRGYPAVLAEVPDAHNFVAWRDALDPNLTELVRRVWTVPGLSRRYLAGG